MTIDTAFGARIRQLRKHHRLDQRALTEQVVELLRRRGGKSFDVTYLSKIENSKVEPPSEPIIRALAEVLDTDADALLALAGRVPQALGETLRSSPSARMFYKSAIDLSLSEEDWQHLLQEARIRKARTADSIIQDGNQKETSQAD